MDPALEQMLEGCKKSDRASQKALYDGYFNQLMGIAVRYVNTQVDAEEILNNAFLRIFRHINKYSGKGSFEGWMKKIVVNCCLTFISRPNYKSQSKIIALKEYQLTGESNLDTADAGFKNNCIEEKYDKEYLLQLIRHLPETTRLVFNLYVFEEYNHQEIGELLDMAERTSQSHLAKARKILSTQIDKNKLISKMQRV